MRIDIDLRLASNPSAHRWLDRILHKIEDGWHVWDTTAVVDPTAFRATTWITDRGSQGTWVWGMLVASIKCNAWPSSLHRRRLRVTSNPTTTRDMKPKAAARFAEEPLAVLVENRFSDGLFVERVVKELDNGLSRLWDRKSDPIRLDSVGGVGQMEHEVQRRVRGAPVRPRLVVIVDSDRRYPHGRVNDAARKLRGRCRKLNVPCWVLAKRASENYLPPTLLSERKNVGADHDLLVQAWDELNDDQKDFFDMKRGLSDRMADEAEEALYEGLSNGTRRLLMRGFGSNVYKCWKLWRGQVKRELLDRGRGDLEYGIGLIRREV